jgi:glycine cleavage system aminomethyltransferase T
VGLGVAGAEALELMRVEDGRLKPGVDWLPAQVVPNDDELRVPMDFGVSPDMTRRFNGVDALRRATSSGRQMPVQLIANEGLVRGSLAAKGSVIGRVTSTAWSEARNEAVALAWVDPAVASAGAVLTAPGPAGPVDVRVALAAQSRNA